MGTTQQSQKQQFSLRWNNYAVHVTSMLDELRTEDELTDVTLCAEGGKVRAHKVLLSACSSFFRETFRENPCQHPVIILKGVSFPDLGSIVTFMYNGQVNIGQERLSSFLQTAELLQIKGLCDKQGNGAFQSASGANTVTPATPTTATSATNSLLKYKNKKNAVMNSPATAMMPHTRTNSSDTQAQYKNDVVHSRPSTPKRRKVPAVGGSAHSRPVSSASSSHQLAIGPPPSHGHSSSSEVRYINSPLVAVSSPVVENGTNGNDGEDEGMESFVPIQNQKEDEEDGGSDEEGVYPRGLKFQSEDAGEEEDEYGNNEDLIDNDGDGDNSLQDLNGLMEQGPGGGGGVGDDGNGTYEEVILADDYSIIPDGDDSSEDAPILTPVIVSTTSKSIPSIRHLRQLPTQSSSSSTTTTPSRPHRTVLRKSLLRRPQEPAEVDPLSTSPSRLCKPQSPYVGEPVMDEETGEMMFPCLMCDKKYKLKSSLESHVKVHEGVDTTCLVCGQTMSRQRDLKRHVASVHRGLLMPDGTITYPEDIEEIVPIRPRGKGW